MTTSGPAGRGSTASTPRAPRTRRPSGRSGDGRKSSSRPFRSGSTRRTTRRTRRAGRRESREEALPAGAPAPVLLHPLPADEGGAPPGGRPLRGLGEVYPPVAPLRIPAGREAPKERAPQMAPLGAPPVAPSG